MSFYAIMTNSADGVQTAPLGTAGSGSALFAFTCLSKYFGKFVTS